MSGHATTRAALFEGPTRGFRHADLPVPMPAPGEVLVRVDLTTLCGSDLRSVDGRRAVPVPTILGHEVVGRVAALGAPVRALGGAELQIGDRVVWSVVAACGACARCRRGFPQKCVALVKFGHAAQPPSGARLDGGLAQHVLLPRGAAIARVGAAVPDAIAALSTCAGATAAAAVRVVSEGSALGGARVLVLGAGALGLFATLLAREAGAAEVHVVDVDAPRLAAAKELGATHVHRAAEATEEREPSDFDAALELSGAPAACERAVRAVGVGGRVVFAGAVSPVGMVSLDPEALVRRLARIEGVHNYRPDDLATAVALAESRGARWPAALAMPERFALDEVAAAFSRAAAERPLRVAVAP